MYNSKYDRKLRQFPLNIYSPGYVCNVQPITIIQRAQHFVGHGMINLVITHVAIEGRKSAYRVGKELIAIEVSVMCDGFFGWAAVNKFDL